MQKINSKRYTRRDIEEGENYIRHGYLPVRLRYHVIRQAAFIDKWKHVEVAGNGNLVSDGRRLIAREDVAGILQQAFFPCL